MILDFLFTLNSLEAILLLSLFLCSSYPLYESYLNKNWVFLFNPINLFALLTLFYCVIGPIVSSANSDGSIFYRAIDHREYYQIGLLAALVSFLAFKLGFDYKNNFLIKDYGSNKKIDSLKDKKNYLILFKWGEKIVIFTLICQFIVFGVGFVNKIRFIGNFDINQVSVLYAGNFQNLFIFTINFLILAIPLMFIALLNGIKEKPKFIFYSTIAVSMFLNAGFRWRVFMLFFPIILIYFFYKKTKPKIISLISFILSALLILGFIQAARSYGYGLSINNFEKSQGTSGIFTRSSINKIFKASFFDSNIFNSSAGIIHVSYTESNYTGFAAVINALATPIPRKLWPGKPSGEYITKLYKKVYTGYLWEVGSASFGFAEYFISGGWIALIALNFLLGYLYKRLWIWFFYNFYDPLAQITYASNLGFLFIIYTRGYLLQLVFLYLTIFTPLILLSYFWNKKFIA